MKKISKVNFNTKMGITLNKLYGIISSTKHQCKISHGCLIINSVKDLDELDEVQDVILDTVTNVFECSKPRKVIKMNYFDNTVYCRFKKAM